MIPVVLASGSAVRARLLSAAGVNFEIAAARIDEEVVKHALLAEGASSAAIADHLAELKAIRVSVSRPNDLVIGADQILAFRKEIVSKSANLAEARSLLRRLQGQSHELISASVLAKNGRAVWRYTARAELHMREFSGAFLDDYLEAEGPHLLDSVGCYHLEGYGAQLFSSVSGDYFAVLGLPLLPLLSALREFGAIPA